MVPNKQNKTEDKNPDTKSESPNIFAAPSISMPTGGGAIRGIGEKFAANPVTGTGSMTVPIAVSPGRSNFGPQLSLSYDSGSGNGPFGFGWKLSSPAITRKTDKGLPQYFDNKESDVYIISGAEDLVPVLKSDGTLFEDKTVPGFTIHRYRPRVEAGFARIERWTDQNTGEIHWRSISRDNITTLYGTTDNSRITDPDDGSRVFTWLISQSYDDKGNAIVYDYLAENDDNVDYSRVNEFHRRRTANRYLKHIKYGNVISRLVEPDLTKTDWLFEVVFDYDEGHYRELALDPAKSEGEQHRYALASDLSATAWALRPDPFSSYRAGFEVRTYRRCSRVLMFHRFSELGAEPCLVRSTDFDYADEDYAKPDTIDDELNYPGSNRFASVVRAITQSGYVRDSSQPVVLQNNVAFVTYLKKSLPPIEFEYSKAIIQDDIRELDRASLENLPFGLDGTAYRFVDLDGEGVSGILTEQAGDWFYKPSRGDGKFGAMQKVATLPSLASLGGGKQQLLDLDGDGHLDLVEFSGQTPGFFERTKVESWETFRAFPSLPSIDWEDHNLRFVDLNGDGFADVLITERDVITWYPSLAEGGFGSAQRVHQPTNEEKGPQLVFADGTQSIYLADMSGDGLTDLARIRNGEVCYWPNLGYGRFGAKVTMDQSPWFDNFDLFEQQRIRLADIDGSGTIDIIYLGRDGARLYFNQCGNSWSRPRPLTQFPVMDSLSAVTTADLLGNGTACLVWSSPLPADTSRPVRYIDLMGGQKPHLMIKTVNNLGAETLVAYAPSTKFYLADKAAGTPWITRISFPVYVVERVETYDNISGNRFVTRYAYHHGYFDGVEREFNGFGMVEQWDVEEFAALNENQQLPTGTNLDKSSNVPPILTRTWFHTGIYLGRDRVSNFYAGLLKDQNTGEYYREPGLTDAQARALLLDDTVLPDGLTVEEEREACRALKGSALRKEIYALDGTDKQQHPYSVTEQNFTVECSQLKFANKYGVFFTHPRESLSYGYERNPSDPRITHALTFEVDDFGSVLKSASVVYGRRQADPDLQSDDQAKQSQRLVTYTENDVTNSIDSTDDYRAPVASEKRTYELTGYTPSGQAGRFQISDFVQPVVGGMKLDFDSEINYEDKPTIGRQRRIIEQGRNYYRSNDLTGPLGLGVVESLGLPYQNYKLAFTHGLVTSVYSGRATDSFLQDDGRYRHTEGDANWWIPSGQVFYSSVGTDTAAQELDFAKNHFFLARRYRDPFHTAILSTERLVAYDNYDLLLQETLDPLGNRNTTGERNIDPTLPLVSSGLDYRVLQPVLMMDPNRNRSVAAFDALGMVSGVARMGKPEDVVQQGDSLDGFEADLTEAVIAAHVQDPLSDPYSILQRATNRLVYDLFAYYRTKGQASTQPSLVYTLARETHDADLKPGDQTKVQHSFCYSDGFGREVQKKLQAEAGPVPKRDASGHIIIVNGQPDMTTNDVSPRWVGNGWTVFNNKANPVRQYEPFFTDTHQFEFEVKIGVSPVIFYDPMGRAIATLHPNHTWQKTGFDSWKQTISDVSDTVLVTDPKTDLDVGDFFSRLPDEDYLPTWFMQRESGGMGPQEKDAADKTAIHADTPTVSHLDTLGRVFLTIVDNKFKQGNTPAADPPTEEFYSTRIVIDIEGNKREVIDAKDRIAMRYDYDILSDQIHQASMEAGERWLLKDVAGKPIHVWDSRNHHFQTTYDQLRRPVGVYMQDGGNAALLVERTVYGESNSTPESKNQRGKVVQVSDQAGIVTTDDYDFKGNLLNNSRQLAANYKTTFSWSGPVPLENETFTTTTGYDALNRPTQITAPDASIIRHSFNEANLLEQVDVNLRGAPTATPFIANIDYSAKGQRTLVQYANGATTAYDYDAQTSLLVHMKTTRAPGQNGLSSQIFTNPATVQDLQYTHDAAGNITRIEDGALQTIFYNGQQVEPICDFTYDAISRLIEATGREHIGQAAFDYDSPTGSLRDYPFNGLSANPNDLQALRNYTEMYEYDAVGNFETLIHQAGPNGSWTRTYSYNEASLIEPTMQSNRLSNSTVGQTTENFAYDPHGNMIAMRQLTLMQWDFKDQLQSTSSQVVNSGTPLTTYYVYDSIGQRVRKATEQQGGTLTNQRIYLNGFEIYREYNGNVTTATLERQTLHVMDDKRRIAMVETKTVDSGNPVNAPVSVQRYQFDNHLGSASLELDMDGGLISYEEYHPFGSTSYESINSAAEVSLKRYRYTGKERDEETGLFYHGARYYAPWLGRWTAVDPKGIEEGINLYIYVNNNPIKLIDPNGTDPVKLDDFERQWVREVALPILQYDTFKTSTGDKSISLEHRVEMVAQARSESLGKWMDDPKTRNFQEQVGLNMFNLQGQAGTYGFVIGHPWEYRDSARKPESLKPEELARVNPSTPGWHDFEVVTRPNKKTKEPETVVRELYRATVKFPLFATKEDAITAYLNQLQTLGPGALKALTTESGTTEEFFQGLKHYGTHQDYGGSSDTLNSVLSDTTDLLSAYADEKIKDLTASIDYAKTVTPPAGSEEQFKKSMSGLIEHMEYERKFYTDLKAAAVKLKATATAAKAKAKAKAKP